MNSFNVFESLATYIETTPLRLRKDKIYGANDYTLEVYNHVYNYLKKQQNLQPKRVYRNSTEFFITFNNAAICVKLSSSFALLHNNIILLLEYFNNKDDLMPTATKKLFLQIDVSKT